MDDSTYDRAHSLSFSALRILFDEAKANGAFTPLWNFVVSCSRQAESRVGQHMGGTRLEQAAQAAASSVGDSSGEIIDAKALRAVVVHLHLNKQAKELALAEAALQNVLQQVRAHSNMEEFHAGMDALLDQISELLRQCVEIAGCAAMLAYEGLDHQGAIDAKREGELVELDRQVARLHNTLHPQSG